jgi:hypothetical protein
MADDALVACSLRIYTDKGFDDISMNQGKKKGPGNRHYPGP